MMCSNEHFIMTSIYQPRRPPPPPFDIETMEPIEPPWVAIKEWIPDDEPDLNLFNQERKPEWDDSRQYVQRVHRSLGGCCNTIAALKFFYNTEVSEGVFSKIRLVTGILFRNLC
jgi:hypothetical protein